MPSAGWKTTPARSSGCGTARRAREEAVAAHRAEVERAQREADWLRHAVDELTQLAPQAGEETALAERRAAMMQAREGRRRSARRPRGGRGRAVAGAGAVRPRCAGSSGAPRRRRR